MMFWWGDHMGPWGWVLMTVSWVAFWVLIVVGVVALLRYVRTPSAGGRQEPTARPTPEQLLAERFARGEIDETEYRRRLDTLAEARADRGPARPV